MEKAGEEAGEVAQAEGRSLKRMRGGRGEAQRKTEAHPED